MGKALVKAWSMVKATACTICGGAWLALAAAFNGCNQTRVLQLPIVCLSDKATTSFTSGSLYNAGTFNPMHQLAILEDEQQTRSYLRSVVEASEGFEVVADFGDAESRSEE